MNKELFIEELKKLGIDITEEQLNKLNSFYKLLIEWNEKINLTRITEANEVYLKHFYDSLTIKKVIDLNDVETLCDVGTGAGFPGIVLKIMYPHLKITLVDSLQKRVNYLNSIIKDLELDNIKAIHSRGEDFKEKFDVVTARAVANIEKLVTYTMHLVNKDGQLVAMKGNIEEELNKIVQQKLSKKYQIVKQIKKLYPDGNIDKITKEHPAEYFKIARLARQEGLFINDWCAENGLTYTIGQEVKRLGRMKVDPARRERELTTVRNNLLAQYNQSTLESPVARYRFKKQIAQKTMEIINNPVPIQ